MSLVPGLSVVMAIVAVLSTLVAADTDLYNTPLVRQRDQLAIPVSSLVGTLPGKHTFPAVDQLLIPLTSLVGVPPGKHTLPAVDQLAIPESSLVGTPPGKHTFLTGALFPTSQPYEKRSARRFRTTSRKEAYQVCTPSRHEVIRLLVALHEARQGRNMNKIIHLCNRQTNAADVDTNIRFLG
ncbi:hypothetical protein OTU49_003755 [Cherax quadricarinatus]|uniref:Secreted protein n=2 Tax=Cherax quadricarinatus TaxID=27406 RepID=A0AAW0XGS4_CHEQU